MAGFKSKNNQKIISARQIEGNEYTSFSSRVVPKGWNAKACHLWWKGQRVEAVQSAINSLNNNESNPPPLFAQISYYLFLLNDYKSAVTILEHQAKIYPDDMEVLQNLSVCYSRIARNSEAVSYAQEALKKEPDNTVALDVLAKTFHKLNRDSEATEAGTRSLEIKDRIVNKPNKNWVFPSSDPGSFARSDSKQDVISFSLWGNNPQYLRGALRNLILARKLYPRWVIRFYLDESVPAEFTELIENLGGKVLMQKSNQSIKQKLCWRFQVANDSGVGYFLIRDVDSVFSVREVQAVTTWLESDLWFHVMRDWWTHTDLILAGLWGGVAGVLPPLKPMLEKYQCRVAETPNIDQWFLRDQVWPYIRQSCLVHDRCFRMVNSIPFPGTTPKGNYHIGQNEMAARGRAQERFLRSWIKKYSCLGPFQY